MQESVPVGTWTIAAIRGLDAENVAQVKRVFTAASGYRMPIVVHMHTSIDNKRRYGADQARVFLNDLLAAALDIPVQIAHLAGAGGYNDTTDSALRVFTDALAKHDARMKNVWFDVSAVVRPGMPLAELQRIAARIRQIGVDRVLYGSDAAASPLAYPKAAWEAFQRVPLTPAEFRTITVNLAPHMKATSTARPVTQDWSPTVPASLPRLLVGRRAGSE